MDDRRPITFDLLAFLFRVLPSVCFSDFESVLFQAAFSLAFFAALCLSELVAQKAGFISGYSFRT